MMSSRLPRFLMRVFAPRRRSDYFTKPALTLLAFLLVYVATETAVLGWTPDGLAMRLLALALVQGPFMAVAFILVIYLESVQSGLADLAMTDALTGLPNRRAFIDHVNHYQENGEIGYLLIIDADHFKQINDTYGHAVGDACIIAIAARLQATKAPQDVIGRIGGEEFGAYLPLSTEENLLLLGQRLCREIKVTPKNSGEPIRFTLSVGAAETLEKEPVPTALARADEALYVAKENGRARLVVWNKQLRKVA